MDGVQVLAGGIERDGDRHGAVPHAAQRERPGRKARAFTLNLLAR
jgi:hypothetical protein